MISLIILVIYIMFYDIFVLVNDHDVFAYKASDLITNQHIFAGHYYVYYNSSCHKLPARVTLTGVASSRLSS